MANLSQFGTHAERKREWSNITPQRYSLNELIIFLIYLDVLSEYISFKASQVEVYIERINRDNKRA